MKLFETRASVVLYKALCTFERNGTFLLPLNVCPIVPAVFLKAGLQIRFVDISRDTLCMDETLLLEAVQADSSITGVLFVKTFGIELNTDALFAKIRSIRKDMFIIDDCCLQQPNFAYDLDSSGADLALFSTGYSKYVDLDWGGFGFLLDVSRYAEVEIPYSKNALELFTAATQRCIDLREMLAYEDTNWLGDDRQTYRCFAEYRDAVETVMERVRTHKAVLNGIYRESIPPENQLGDEYSDWRYSILVERKDDLLKAIFAAGLFASSHYKEVDYMFNRASQQESVAQQVHSKIVNLFNGFRFQPQQAEKIIQIVNNHIREVQE